MLCRPTTNISQVAPGQSGNPHARGAKKLLSLSHILQGKINIQSKQLNSLVINKNMSGELSTLVSIALKAKYETAGKPLFAFFNLIGVYFSDAFQVIEHEGKVN